MAMIREGLGAGGWGVGGCTGRWRLRGPAGGGPGGGGGGGGGGWIGGGGGAGGGGRGGQKRGVRGQRPGTGESRGTMVGAGAVGRLLAFLLMAAPLAAQFSNGYASRRTITV